MSTPPSDNESIAALLYSRYCDAVGGVAFNGDKLPSWDAFVADAAKTKQVEAWRAVASFASELLRGDTV